MSAYPIEKIKQVSGELWKTIIYIDVDIPIYDNERIPVLGIYILVNEFGERYIGSSISILNRQKNHHIKNVKTIDIFLIKDIRVVRSLESTLIYRLYPELNRYKLHVMNEIGKSLVARILTKEYLKKRRDLESESVSEC